ncbi:DNA-processing protein DprA [Simplicispira psychrophila]|uniref:DNA-processing protein DprA n=1 Tax=Simplicispira psychrophila TaxID=80882 RepID=UPI0004800597|nr:DNA-processing protein DprA [Simplicispira psychrophila]
MERDDLCAWLRLTLTPGIGNAAARRLLQAFGLPQAIFQQSFHALQQCVTAVQAQALLQEPAGLAALLDTTWQWLHAAPSGGPARTLLALGDVQYPSLLLETEDPPLLLYLLGAARFIGPGAEPFPRGTCLAIVGSRHPTAQGQDNARQFARALRATGLTIVSGLALGVDAAAHEGALADAQESDSTPATLAIVGTGLDRVYPRRHLDLAHRIAAHGLLVSEYPLGTPPLPGNFPKRNRIIAGLSQGTLVVEAAPASGSLITARLASEQGREVFAIPGSIHAPQSRGCHALIRQGAKLVETAQDVLEELHLSSPVGLTGLGSRAAAPATARSKRPLPSLLPLPQQRLEVPDTALLQALGYEPAGLDALQARTGLATATLQVELLELELAGEIARLPGGLFQRLGRG